MDISQSLRCYILCVLLVLATAESSQIFYVRPMLLQHNFTCPSQPCLTISEYVRESHSYFLSNSTFIFMPGNHILDSRLNVENVSNIILQSISHEGSHSAGDNFEVAQITCMNEANIRYVNVSELSILSLTFVTCGNSNYNETTGLSFINSNAISIVDTSFHGSVDSALGIRLSYVYITNSSFFNNTASSGGAILAVSSNLTFSGSNSFVGNTAELGGAIYLYECSVYFTGQNNFSHNLAKLITGGFISGGALLISNTTLLLTGESYFNHNAVLWDGNTSGIPPGGAITAVLSSCVSVRGTAVFTENIAPSAGAIHVEQSTLLMNATVTFDSNRAYYLLSGAVFILQSLFISYGRLAFLNNKAVLYGGALSIGGTLTGHLSEVYLLGRTEFLNNSVTSSISYGGAVQAILSHFTMSNVVFNNNSASALAGAMYAANSTASFSGPNVFLNNSANFGGVFNGFGCNVSFSGSNHFENNTASKYGPGAVQFIGCNVSIDGDMTLISNQGRQGGGIYTIQSALQITGNMNLISNVAEANGGSFAIFYGSVTFSGNTNFIGNKAQMQGGAMYAEGSRVRFQSVINFINNSAQLGGALAFSGSTTLTLVSPIHIQSLNNRAHVYGGVIYHADIVTSSICNPPKFAIERRDLIVDCFLIIEMDTPMMLNASASFLFENDTAGLAGTVMYGGLLDTCRMQVITNSETTGNYQYNPLQVLGSISTVIQDDNSTSVISSDPFRLCFCENGIPDCELQMNVSIVSGQQITLSALAVGQNNMSVPTTVTAKSFNNGRLDTFQSLQKTGRQCTTLQYRIFSLSSFGELILYPNGPCRDSGIARQVINVTLLPCPDGFALSDLECVCEERLRRFTTNCTIGNTFSIIRSSISIFWMDTLIVNGTYEGLILYSSCPFDYCVSTPIAITLDNLDIQCDLNRTGTLCGACQKNLSLVFGTSQCKSCSSYYLFLIVPFALAGVLLVILLLGLHLTVASGTLNGLILYANIVQVNRHIFFPTGETNVLTVFIAWLNLDLGIETCFYDGTDAYARTWFQFVFPLYLWFLIGLIIVMSRYSQRIAKMFGSNPVAILATLLLMSYAKILRTIITALSYANLEYPDGSLRKVWLQDGNVKYFQLSGPSHFILVITSLLTLIFLFLPYTFLLLLGPWLYRFSNRKLFSWLNKIKPFMDAYSAPYKKNYRYWTGFLLLIRCGLFLTFAFSNSNLVNLLSISSVLAGLAAIVWLWGRIYEKQYLNILEVALITNLNIFAAVTYYINNASVQQQRILASTMVGFVFCIFIVILMFHTLQQLNWEAICQKVPILNYLVARFRIEAEDEGDLDVDLIQHDRGPIELVAEHTLQPHSHMQQEPLLEYCQYRQ